MAQVFRDVVYGDHPNQRVNLYQPEGYDFITDLGIDIKGVILWIHGGGWVNGHKDINKTNFSNYFLTADLPIIQQLADNNSLDDDACQILADRGYFVISANYRLISTNNPYSGVAALNVGGGEYPNSVEDIRELYKYMTFPNYGIGVNELTWQLIVRYTQTYGLLIIGGSAGGQLAVAGTFQGAGNTGQWPRGLGSVVGPMNIFPAADNPIAAFGRSLVDNYSSSNDTNKKLASPWWRRNASTDPQGVGYENYLGFSDTLNPNKSYNNMKMWFWYNQNDVLVPTNTVEPFIDWARTYLGSDKVLANKVDVYDTSLPIRYRGEWNASLSYTGGAGGFSRSDVVYYSGKMYQALRTIPVNTPPSDPPDNFYWTSGPDSSHNFPPNYSVDDWAQEASKFVFYSGINYPKFQRRLRPTQGMMYPRMRNIGYKPPPPSYTLIASAASVNEGSTATFNLTTVGVVPNTLLTYTLSGVTAQDITGGELSGSVILDENASAVISVGLAADLTSEGTETLTVSVIANGIVVATASTTIADTSVNNEILTLPGSVNLGQNFTTSITGGKANTTASFTWTRNGSQISSGNITLDGSGNYSTNIGSYSQSGTYVLTVTFAASGNTRQATMTVPTETISIPFTQSAYATFTVSASGGVPNTGFSFTWSRNGSVQQSGSGTLDSNGSYSSGQVASLSIAGIWTLQVSFAASGNVLSRNIEIFEILDIQPRNVSVNQSFTVTVTGAVPNSSFNFTWIRNSFITYLTGSGNFDSSGNYSAAGSFPETGNYRLSVTYNETGHINNVSIFVT